MIANGVSGPHVTMESLLAPEPNVQLVDLKKKRGNVRKVILIALHKIQLNYTTKLSLFALHISSGQKTCRTGLLEVCPSRPDIYFFACQVKETTDKFKNMGFNFNISID